MLCPFCQTANADDDETCFSCGRMISGVTKGSLLAGRYEILGRLGKGGMGTVYKAHDKALDETVAVKVLRAGLSSDLDVGRRFRSEIKLARKIAHKNVCRIYDYGEDGPLQFISMQYVDGVDLHQVIQQTGPLPTIEAFDTAAAVAEGLGAVHDEGIVHRDIKTANIMRDRNGAVRLMDFGIAKEWSGRSLTTTGHTLGTPEYMSPEQILGAPVDARSDLYALGAVVFELFTGTVPFRGDTSAAVILKHLNEPPTLEGDEAGSLPASLVPVVARMLAKNPDERYASARDVLIALARARSETSIGGATVRPLGLPRPSQHPTITTPASVLAAAATVQRGATRPPQGRQARRLSWISATVAVVGLAGTVAGWRLLSAPASDAADQPGLRSMELAGTAPAPVPEEAKTRPERPAVAPSEARVQVPPAPPPLRSVPGARAPVDRHTAAPSRSSPPPAAADEAGGKETAGARVGEDGFLQVGARPWAELTVDDKAAGTTPMPPIVLAAGEHKVRLIHPDYEPLERVVTVQPTETSRLFIDFTSMGTRKKPEPD
jgi:serine/threonine-protein kinase